MQKYYTYTNSVSYIERGDDDEPTQALAHTVSEKRRQRSYMIEGELVLIKSRAMEVIEDAW